MKRFTKVLLFIFLMSVNIIYLRADCESDKKAVNDAIVYTKNFILDGENVVGFDIYGLEENEFHINVFNSLNDEIETIKPNGTFTSYLFKYGEGEVDIIAKVYGNSCGEEILKEINVNGSILNKYSQLEVCNDEIGASSLCSVFADTSNMSEEEFVTQVKKDVRKTKLSLFFSRNFNNKSIIYYIAIPFFIIGLGFMIAIWFVKQKRKTEFKKGGK